MKILPKLLAMGLLISFAAGISGCGSKTAETTSPASVPASTEASEPPQLSIDIPLNDVTLPESQAAGNSNSESTAETTAGAAQSPTGDVDLSKVIALTFDDGPDTKDTSSTNRILDVLEQYNCKATFFVQGQAAQEWLPERNKDTVKREADLGMEIGTHTYSHADLRKLTADGVAEEIQKGKQAITDITGNEVSIMRPPYGETSSETQDSIGMPMILWDVDTLDWDTKDAQNTAQVILEKAKGGSIVLMHDIYNTTADAIEIVVPQLVEQGYTLVTVSELFELYGTELKPGYYYTNAREEGTLTSPFSH